MKSNFKGKRVLVTGGLGFLGSNLAIKLVELGADVELYDALIPSQGGNLFNIVPIKKEVKVTIADMRDFAKISKSVRKKDYIFNLAGTLSHVDSMTDPFLDLDINCRAQLFLLEAARKFNRDTRIVFACTRNQYGRTQYLPVDESHPQEPTDINGINSIAAEKYHLLYWKIYGIPTCSIRMTNSFGPRHQMKHPRQGVLNWFIRVLMDRKTVMLYGRGKQIRDVNYVSDVTSALLAAALSKKAVGEVYNLGGTPVSLVDFVKMTIAIMGYGKIKFAPFPKERRGIEIGDYIADTRKIEKELAWRAETSITEGIKKTIDYYNQFKKYYW